MNQNNITLSYLLDQVPLGYSPAWQLSQPLDLDCPEANMNRALPNGTRPYVRRTCIYIHLHHPCIHQLPKFIVYQSSIYH